MNHALAREASPQRVSDRKPAYATPGGGRRAKTRDRAAAPPAGACRGRPASGCAAMTYDAMRGASAPRTRRARPRHRGRLDPAWADVGEGVPRARWLAHALTARRSPFPWRPDARLPSGGHATGALAQDHQRYVRRRACRWGERASRRDVLARTPGLTLRSLCVRCLSFSAPQITAT